MAEEIMPQERKKSSWVMFSLLGLFLIVVIYVVLTLSRGTTSFFGKAASSGVFSAINSYVFASPLTARSGGDKIRVTVFALDGQGKGVVNKNISVGCVDEAACQNARVTFYPVQLATDNLGQAILDLTSAVPGKFELQARVEGTAIPQTVTVSFQ